MKKINNYYIENKHFYINGFANFINEQTEEEYTDEESKKLFKFYMYDYKNIKIDFRLKFWKIVFFEAMKKAGFIFNNQPEL